MDKIVEYNTGNISKYQSGNLLKRYLVKRFDERLMQLLAELDSRIQMNTRGGTNSPFRCRLRRRIFV